jgi:signal transduction histidine kinase
MIDKPGRKEFEFWLRDNTSRLPVVQFAPAKCLRKLLLAAALTILGLEVLSRTRALGWLLSSHYLPHAHCYLQQQWLIWTNVTMDAFIAISYCTIFACLFWIARTLRSVQDLRVYLWLLLAFGTLVVASGGTHLMELVTVWWPAYRLSAGVKILCAAASVPSAILLACAAPTLAATIRGFLEVFSPARWEKEQAMRALVASEKLVVAGRISASISHEIKNPLETAGNLLSILAEDQRMPADLVDVAKTASAELKRVDGIAQSTLALLRSSRSPLPLSLDELVENVLDLQIPQLMRRGISVQHRLRVSGPVKAYSGELRQILFNLIQNAAAAIGSEGRIIVRVQPRRLLVNIGQPGGYSITVADTGHGIDRKQRAHLFTQFFTTQGEEGMGLGLWLVRSMVEKQGGRIRVRSRAATESDKPGTVFNIWIPLQPAPITAPAVAATRSSITVT